MDTTTTINPTETTGTRTSTWITPDGTKKGICQSLKAEIGMRELLLLESEGWLASFWLLIGSQSSDDVLCYLIRSDPSARAKQPSC